MKEMVKAGILLAVLVAVWTYVMAFTGWIADPVLFNMFWLVILINIVVVVLGLRWTAALGYGYGKQVGAGTGMGVVGGVLIFLNSLLLTTVIQPDLVERVHAMQADLVRGSGLTGADLDAALAQLEASSTPMAQAVAGLLGTVGTSLVVSLIAAIFIRHRSR